MLEHFEKNTQAYFNSFINKTLTPVNVKLAKVKKAARSHLSVTYIN